MVKIDGKPRLCKLAMWPDFDGYGFNLHAEKSRPGQYVGKVDEGSPAEAAGLREGDKIIQVNGTNISSENHKQVVSRIKSIPNETELLVVDVETERVYREAGTEISREDAVVISSSTSSSSKELSHAQEVQEETEDEDRKSIESTGSSIDKIKRIRFPLCLTGQPGFDISYYRHNGRFAVSRIHSSLAKQAGLKIGDRLHYINNVNVCDKALQRNDLICLIASIPHEVQLRVSRAPKQWDSFSPYRNHSRGRKHQSIYSSASSSSSSESILFQKNTRATKRLPPPVPQLRRARLCLLKMRPGENKFGFTLLTDKRTDTQHIGNVYPGSPAYRSGVKPQDRIIEVNGVNVENLEHRAIVSLVNKSGPKSVRLLLVDGKTYDYFLRQEIKIHGAMKDLWVVKERTLDPSESSPAPGKIRSCHIIKNEPSESFGFSIQTVKKENTKVIKEISPDGPAERAGLHLDDIVLAVNGEDVIEENHKAVVERIVSRSLDTTLLVTDKDTFNQCREHDIPFLPSTESFKVVEEETSIAMGSTGNSPSPRSTPSPQFSHPSGTHSPVSTRTESPHGELDLNMTAAQMRERISAKKKRDPRKDDRMDILRKYQIIQTL